MARLQRVVDVAAAAKLGVDMNGLAVMRPAAAPRWLADATDAELHTAHRTFWSGCAAQFKGQGAILAFDLINEPIQPDRRTASLSGGEELAKRTGLTDWQLVSWIMKIHCGEPKYMRNLGSPTWWHGQPGSRNFKNEKAGPCQNARQHPANFFRKNIMFAVFL